MLKKLFAMTVMLVIMAPGVMQAASGRAWHFENASWIATQGQQYKAHHENVPCITTPSLPSGDMDFWGFPIEISRYSGPETHWILLDQPGVISQIGYWSDETETGCIALEGPGDHDLKCIFTDNDYEAFAGFYRDPNKPIEYYEGVFDWGEGTEYLDFDYTVTDQGVSGFWNDLDYHHKRGSTYPNCASSTYIDSAYGFYYKVYLVEISVTNPNGSVSYYPDQYIVYPTAGDPFVSRYSPLRAFPGISNSASHEFWTVYTPSGHVYYDLPDTTTDDFEIWCNYTPFL